MNITPDLFPIARLHPLIEDHRINRTFDEILALTEDGFVAYVREMRAAILTYWDDEGLPPRRGWTYAEITKEFGKLSGFDVQRFWKTDELSQRRVIHNTYVSTGSAVNAWHASKMYQTRINYTEKDDGKSIYDFFAKPEFFERYLPYARRHFLRDSFYMFALTVTGGTSLSHRPEIIPETAVDFVTQFAAHERSYQTQELLMEAKLVAKAQQYTGYNDKMRVSPMMVLTFAEYRAAIDAGLLPPITRRNILSKHEDDSYEFHVRIYTKGHRLFPNLFRSFRISMCQYAVNYPTLTAKLLYETFLAHVDAPTVRVWDPSAGWAGRLLGALAYSPRTKQDQRLEYYGTDPNPAFYKEGTSVYRVIADYYNKIRGEASLFGETNTGTVYQLGSEDFPETPAYQQYVGKGDMVFSSPPYFNREAYSEDANQSYKKFTSYDVWRDQFLRVTLQHTFDWLNHKRYLLWNIADLKVGKKFLPLEQDSKQIAHEIGYIYKETILMALMNMPGANRVTEDGEATAKNYLKMNGKIMKYEPVHVFWKP